MTVTNVPRIYPASPAPLTPPAYEDGQTVVIAEASAYRLATVERTTATLVVADGRRWRKSNGTYASGYRAEDGTGRLYAPGDQFYDVILERAQLPQAVAADAARVVAYGSISPARANARQGEADARRAAAAARDELRAAYFAEPRDYVAEHEAMVRAFRADTAADHSRALIAELDQREAQLHAARHAGRQ